MEDRERDERISPEALTLGGATGREDGEKSPLRKKIENFFYYYKWHTLAGILLVLIAVVLIAQTCSKVDYDAYLLYAGPQYVNKTSQNGDISPYETLLASAKTYAKDENGDKKIHVSLETLCVPSAEGYEGTASAAQIAEDRERLADVMTVGNYYVCLLSEANFLLYEERLAPIAPYTNGREEDYLFASEKGIYLSSTALGQKAGFSSLPEDTVICIRILSELSSRISASDRETYAAAEEFLRALLAAG